ncbi:hypothetical protein PQQ87_08780 [Paraburkholderia nemoris]|uniref:hypothetical protein n=1 Tax=Paraburkholderia nemoris TaxID=2793076 RepID=UPI0038B98EBE
MNEINEILAVAFVAILIGCGVGVYVRGDHDKAAEVTQTAKAQKQTAAEIVQATQESQAVAAKVAANDAAVDADKQAAHERVVTRVQYVYKENDSEKTAQDCGPAYLDVGTVRLLNAARSGRALDSTSGSDGASAAVAASATTP